MSCSHKAQSIIHEAGARAQTPRISGSLLRWKIWLNFQFCFVFLNRVRNIVQLVTEHRTYDLVTAISEQPRGSLSEYFKMQELSIFSSHEGRWSPTRRTAEPASEPPWSAHSDHLTVTTGSPQGQILHQQKSLCVGAQQSHVRLQKRVCHSLLNKLEPDTGRKERCLHEDMAWRKCWRVHINVSQ